MKPIPYSTEWLIANAYDPSLAGCADTDPRWIEAVAQKRAMKLPKRSLPIQRIPDDFDPDQERRRLRQGGCCGGGRR